MKRRLLLSLAAITVAASAFSFGKKDVTEENLGPENSWQETFDINSKKDGKYNIVVTAEDKAGNIGTAGPFNIYIDGESDLPVTQIVNPVPDMKIPGNLNIVGTCTDDDKVSEVYLILDGDEANPIKVEGTDYWSYYLDTTKMAEGKHTIEAFGVDDGNPEAFKTESGTIDKSKVIPKTGHRVLVNWELNRRSPVIEVGNMAMGALVSGKINLEGTIRDGNGIKSLFYSTDGGKTYKALKFKKVESKEALASGENFWYTFSLGIDTSKFKDGPTLCMFKSFDNLSTEGAYSFLYYIDNTKPDVKIVSPAAGTSANGVFTIAGYAKDTIGLKSLSWKWGTESENFDLVPGNPYFAKTVDSRGMSGSGDFIVTAVDTSGNTVELVTKIPLDQEADKPIVSIKSPQNATIIEGSEGSLFIRGFAQDDDGLVSVTYSLDGGEEKTLEASGVFYASIEGSLSAGSHTLTAYASDRYGTKGNKTKSTFISRGPLPEYGTLKLKDSSGTREIDNGSQINPEAEAKLLMDVNSGCGLKSLSYSINWGKSESISKKIDIEASAKNFSVEIPLDSQDIPWGPVQVEVSARDIYDREKSICKVLNIIDLTKTHTNQAGIYFDDSTVDSNGGMLSGTNITGYFAGGSIASAQIVPPSKAINLERDGNLLTINGKSASEKFRIRVTTNEGAVYNSRELFFLANIPAPSLTLEDKSLETGLPTKLLDENKGLSINGSVTSEGPVKVKYRVITAKAFLKDGIAIAAPAGYQPEIQDFSQAEEVKLNRRGQFVINLKYQDIPEGISVVEVEAVNNSGKRTTSAAIVENFPEKRTLQLFEGEEIPEPADPAIYWIHGNEADSDYYGICIYQGKIINNFSNDSPFVYKKYSQLPAGKQTLTFEAKPYGQEKAVPVSASINASKSSLIEGEFTSLNGVKYKSGMEFVMDRGTPQEKAGMLTLAIRSNTPIASVKWTVSGEEFAGGKQKQSGTAQVTELDGQNYEASIPLYDLPARLNKIEAVITDASGASASVRGTVSIIRRHGIIDNRPALYWAASGKDVTLDKGQSVIAYANINGKLKSADIIRNSSGLEASVEGNIVKVTANRDGLFQNVTVRAVTEEGATISSQPLNILSDTASPALELKAPELYKYIGNTLTFSGSVSDANGIESLEYTIEDDRVEEKGEEDSQTSPEIIKANWQPLAVNRNGTFSAKINIQNMEDGYIPLSIRAKDKAGKTSFANTVFFKDTTPPEAKIIVPEEGSVINGETLFVFSIKDNGVNKNIRYTSPDKKTVKDYPLTLIQAEGDDTNGPLPFTLIGGKNQPIDNTMSFTFEDAAGNKSYINEFAFKVDTESDLPVAEIHLPVENAVITTDFIISGVVYDDDGIKTLDGRICKIFYKIDNNPFTELENPEGRSSFQINVPLQSMTDNEHSVTVYVEDINGVKGREVKRNFRISLEEPKGGITSPIITETVKDEVVIKGWASDKNGISRVQVSLDNGATFNDTILLAGKNREDTAQWSYSFDTHVIQDGTHVIFVRLWDGYEITGLYSTLINIDNTAPELRLELPLDDSTTAKNVFFSGQTIDNIGLTDLYITIRSLEGKNVPEKLRQINLIPERIISFALDVSQLDNGLYNFELSGKDKAGNITNLSRNIKIQKKSELSKVNLLYPLNGEHVQGDFNIYGSAEIEDDTIESIQLILDGKVIPGVTTKPTQNKYFKFRMGKELHLFKKASDKDGSESKLEDEYYPIEAGVHTYKVVATTASGKSISSFERTFTYNPYGPWVTLDNFTYGDFAVNRPKLSGNAGYTLSPEEEAALKAKETPEEIIEALKAKKVKRVYLSFNNGRTYIPVSKNKKGDWSYRVENTDIAEGYHFLLIKAVMENGENAITRTIVQVDRTLPTVRLISPGEGGHYNQQLNFDGLSSDDIDLKDVKLTLRSGDKSSYEVPGFIQGLYFNVQGWGASLWSFGVGLTAFDNAVKIEADFGQFTQSQRDTISDLFGIDRTGLRYGGNIMGAKIIAQIAYLPFNYFFGHDFDWLSATISVGANFSCFSESGASKLYESSSIQVLSAALMQIEFPRVVNPNWKYFKTWSLYWEPQIWFIPSDVANANIQTWVPTFGIGIRTSVF